MAMMGVGLSAVGRALGRLVGIRASSGDDGAKYGWGRFFVLGGGAEEGTNGVVGRAPDAALGVSAYYACMRVIAQTLKNLPVRVVREGANGKENVVGHRLVGLLERPNPNMGRRKFLETLELYKLGWGNGYGGMPPGTRLSPQSRPGAHSLIRRFGVLLW